MQFPLIYFWLSLIVFAMNAAPAFMPPTWSVLVLFYLTYHTKLIPLVLLGALFATLGRMTLYFFSESFRRFLSKKSKKNLGSLGKYFHKHKKIGIPLFFLYGFSPIPSNELFIIAGLSQWSIKKLAFSFFTMRIFTYTLWVHAATTVALNIMDVFGEHFRKRNFFLFDIAGFLIIYIISRIDWKHVFKVFKLS